MATTQMDAGSTTALGRPPWMAVENEFNGIQQPTLRVKVNSSPLFNQK